MHGNIAHRSADIEALRVRPSVGLDEYEQYIAPARERLANSRGVRTLLSRGEAQFFHSFLLYFCSLGVRMTEPVEGAEWVRVPESGIRTQAIEKAREVWLPDEQRLPERPEALRGRHADLTGAIAPAVRTGFPF